LWNKFLKGSIIARFNEYLTTYQYHWYRCLLYLFARWTNISYREIFLVCSRAGHLGHTMMITMKLLFILVTIDMLWKCYYNGNIFIVLISGRLSYKIPWRLPWRYICLLQTGYYERMIDHNTGRVLKNVVCYFPCYCSCSRQVTVDSSRRELQWQLQAWSKWLQQWWRKWSHQVSIIKEAWKEKWVLDILHLYACQPSH